MPILVSSEVRAALGGPGLPSCESRSLLQRSFLFRDEKLTEQKQIALALLLRDGGATLTALKETHQTVRDKQQYLAENTEKSDEERQRARDTVATKNAIIAKFDPLVARPNQPQVFARSPHWLAGIPVQRRRTFSLTTVERLLIGLSDGALENAGIQLDRFFGIPYLSGSAIKGVALDAAEYVPGAGDEAVRIFGNPFGSDDSKRKGSVSFLTACPTDPNAAVVLDVLTPHYPKYYSRDTHHPNAAAKDDEAPVPLPFPAVGSDVEFRFDLLCLEPGVDEATAARLLELAEKCVIAALTTRGIGAKTRAGYGLFRVSGAQPAFAVGRDLFPVDQISLLKKKWAVVNSFAAAGIAAALSQILDDTEMRKAFEDLIPENLRRQTTDRFWAAFRISPNGPAVLARLNPPIP